MTAETQPQASGQQKVREALMAIADTAADAEEVRDIGLTLGLLVEVGGGSVTLADPWWPEDQPGGYRQGQPLS